MLRSAIWEELKLLDDIIRNATATYEGESFTYEKVCARWFGECFLNDILNLHHVIEYVYSIWTIHSSWTAFFLEQLPVARILNKISIKLHHFGAAICRNNNKFFSRFFICSPFAIFRKNMNRFYFFFPKIFWWEFGAFLSNDEHSFNSIWKELQILVLSTQKYDENVCSNEQNCLILDFCTGVTSSRKSWSIFGST